jgi:hypothetical protein
LDELRTGSGTAEILCECARSQEKQKPSIEENTSSSTSSRVRVDCHFTQRGRLCPAEQPSGVVVSLNGSDGFSTASNKSNRGNNAAMPDAARIDAMPYSVQGRPVRRRQLRVLIPATTVFLDFGNSTPSCGRQPTRHRQMVPVCTSQLASKPSSLTQQTHVGIFGRGRA